MKTKHNYRFFNIKTTILNEALALFIAFIWSGAMVFATPTDGTLDTTFNSGTGFTGPVYSTAVQSDGKIIVVGDFTSYNDSLLASKARER